MTSNKECIVTIIIVNCKYTAAFLMAQTIFNVALMCTLSACLNASVATTVILAVMLAKCVRTLQRHQET